jgi:hypothetical protein
MSIYTNPGSSAPEAAAAYVKALLELLGNQDPVAVLQQTPTRLRKLLESLPRDVPTRPEAPGKWSIRDVMQHLADSELVGGFRLRMVLAHDRPPLVGYDQDLWASRLKYSEVTLDEAVDQFMALRRANVRIWAGLSAADLARVGLHAERGEETLQHLRNLHAAHDLVHLKQLERIRKTHLGPS